MNDTTKTFQLPILNIFVGAFLLTGKNIGKLLKYGSPLILIFGVVITYFSLHFKASSTMLLNFYRLRNQFGELAILVALIAIFALQVVVFSGFYRVFLLKPNVVAKMKILRWSDRETRFMWWTLFIALSIVLTLYLLGEILTFLMWEFPSYMRDKTVLKLIFYSINIIIFYIVNRWSILLPAIAIDKKKNISWAWKISKANGCHLMLLNGALPLATVLILYLLPTFDSLAYYLILAFICFIVSIIQTGIISLSSYYLSKNEEETNTTESVAC